MDTDTHGGTTAGGTRGEDGLRQAMERGLRRHRLCFDLRPPPSRTVRNTCLRRPPRLQPPEKTSTPADHSPPVPGSFESALTSIQKSPGFSPFPPLVEGTLFLSLVIQSQGPEVETSPTVRGGESPPLPDPQTPTPSPGGTSSGVFSQRLVVRTQLTLDNTSVN